MATMIIPSKAYGARTKRAAAGPGFFSRAYAALKAARQREADALVAQYMGERWTDSVEREVNDKLIRMHNAGWR